MNNPQKELVSNALNWQIAYAARELRHNKTVTLSCLQGEAGQVVEQLNTFSYTQPIKMKTLNKPNSKEVLLEIVEI